MIVYDKPVLRRQYTEEASKQGHLHEGKFASINAAGEIALEDNDTMPHGVISEPDGQLRSMLGNRTGASIILWSSQSIVQAQLGTDPGTIKMNTPLKRNADGTVSASSETAGDLIVGYAVQDVATTKAGQLIANATFEPFLVYGLVAVLYFALCFPISIWSQRLEKRMRPKH